jgi:hypothetical protein
MRAINGDILTVCRAIDVEDNLSGKSQLRRIVVMLTKLVARNESVSETPSVYETAFEHEHRYAEHEHEHEEMPEQGDATEFSVMSRLLEI